MRRKIKFTPTADQQLSALEKTPSKAALLAQVRKAIGFLEIDLHYPGLQTHEFTSLSGANGEKVFEAYAQNKPPGAYRISWHYGPDEVKGKKRTPIITIITIIAITPHPKWIEVQLRLSVSEQWLAKADTGPPERARGCGTIPLYLCFLRVRPSDGIWPMNCCELGHQHHPGGLRWRISSGFATWFRGHSART